MPSSAQRARAVSEKLVFAEAGHDECCALGLVEVIVLGVDPLGV
jgi:hypothetical protein